MEPEAGKRKAQSNPIKQQNGYKQRPAIPRKRRRPKAIAKGTGWESITRAKKNVSKTKASHLMIMKSTRNRKSTSHNLTDRSLA